MVQLSSIKRLLISNYLAISNSYVQYNIQNRLIFQKNKQLNIKVFFPAPLQSHSTLNQQLTNNSHLNMNPSLTMFSAAFLILACSLQTVTADTFCHYCPMDKLDNQAIDCRNPETDFMGVSIDCKEDAGKNGRLCLKQSGKTEDFGKWSIKNIL